MRLFLLFAKIFLFGLQFNNLILPISKSIGLIFFIYSVILLSEFFISYIINFIYKIVNFLNVYLLGFLMYSFFITLLSSTLKYIITGLMHFMLISLSESFQVVSFAIFFHWLGYISHSFWNLFILYILLFYTRHWIWYVKKMLILLLSSEERWLFDCALDSYMIWHANLLYKDQKYIYFLYVHFY